MEASVILVSWNSREDLGPCLDSLARQSLPREQFEVLLIDNGSTDRSVEFVRDNCPWVRTFQNQRNNYAAANNLGIERARGRYVALLNVDTRVEPDWMETLIRSMEDHPRVGAVTCKIYEQAPRLYAVGMREKDDLDWEPIGHREEDDGRYDGVYPVGFISHCATLYRRRCLDDVGGLDEDFMMYHEDVDMSIRLRRAKWGLLVNTDGVVHHTVHGSVVQARHVFNYYIDRNRLYVIAKHYPNQFAQHFARSPFHQYRYEDNSNESLQKDLTRLLGKWFKAPDYHTPNLPEDVATILRIFKERSHDRVDQVEVDLKLKSEGLLRAICQLEFDVKQLKKDLDSLRRRGAR